MNDKVNYATFIDLALNSDEEHESYGYSAPEAAIHATNLLKSEQPELYEADITYDH